MDQSRAVEQHPVPDADGLDLVHLVIYREKGEKVIWVVRAHTGMTKGDVTPRPPRAVEISASPSCLFTEVQPLPNL